MLARADEVPAPADEAAIRKNVQAAVEAFNHRDAKALAALWSPEAVYTSRTSGTNLVGRTAIEKDYQDLFESKKDRKLAIDVSSIDFVSPNVAIERGTAKITGGDEPVDETDYSAVHVKRDGKWLLDRLTEDKVEKPPTHYEQLKELEWLVGNWIDDDQEDNAQISTECQWAKNQNYITRAFKVSIGDRVAMSGMQIIGWDGAAKKIRSWVFDSDGGYGEGVWHRKGNRWYIKQSGVLPDGQRSSEVNILTKLDDNTFTWQSTNREIDGDLQPNLDEIKVVRDTGK
ncbi:MAG: SgcJ/EcaC family oxidoreductase [Planctomycetes bacterium]|nr:SgcJ/EcaC family oxidoreductase [Planctomycetota bacterium]